jgi:hypothetical protein
MKADWEYDPADPSRSQTAGAGLWLSTRDWLVAALILIVVLAGGLISAS